MPDKQNDNKFMAMLERWGIVREAGSEDELNEATPAVERPSPDAELRSIFGTSADSPKVTPAARQPVPGIINPVIPSAQQPSGAEHPRAAQTPMVGYPRPAETSKSEQPSDVGASKFDNHKSEDSSGVQQYKPDEASKAEQPRPAEAPTAEQRRAPDAPAAIAQQPRSVGIPIPSLSAGFNPFADKHAADEMEYTAQNRPGEYQNPPESPPVENYTDRYLEIDALYDALSIKSKRTDSIYLIEEYLNTLPDSLPDESRREIAIKIIAASGFDFDRLIGDGVLRVKMLKEYAERFAQYTEEYVTARDSELDELEKQIVRIRKLIENRRELHKKQFYAIETEAQRLKEILTFVTG